MSLELPPGLDWPLCHGTGAPFEKMKCFEGNSPGNVVKCFVY